mmetsp:Transcript_17786/g.61500  ORF Transcript_17786/g.61500 Transcript_17786/m.61500 type:complete len:220 (-) Transcript_17786:332-991(-)
MERPAVGKPRLSAPRRATLEAHDRPLSRPARLRSRRGTRRSGGSPEKPPRATRAPQPQADGTSREGQALEKEPARQQAAVSHRHKRGEEASRSQRQCRGTCSTSTLRTRWLGLSELQTASRPSACPSSSDPPSPSPPRRRHPRSAPAAGRGPARRRGSARAPVTSTRRMCRRSGSRWTRGASRPPVEHRSRRRRGGPRGARVGARSRERRGKASRSRTS